MKLETGLGTIKHNPSEQEIRETIRSLPGGENSFAILQTGDDDQHYMQVAVAPNQNFQLEYRVGSEAEHYECRTKPLSEEQVADAFVSYRNGDSSFKEVLEWKPLFRGSGCLPVFVGVLLLGVGLVFT